MSDGFDRLHDGLMPWPTRMAQSEDYPVGAHLVAIATKLPDDIIDSTDDESVLRDGLKGQISR